MLDDRLLDSKFGHPRVAICQGRTGKDMRLMVEAVRFHIKTKGHFSLASMQCSFVWLSPQIRRRYSKEYRQIVAGFRAWHPGLQIAMLTKNRAVGIQVRFILRGGRAYRFQQMDLVCLCFRGVDEEKVAAVGVSILKTLSSIVTN